MKNFDQYYILADLFDYPDQDFPKKVTQVQEFLDKNYPDAGIILKEFTEFVSKVKLHETEELFTRSFDVQAITTLDLGFLLFGDDYKRAELLVNLNREHREVKNDCYNELADHLPNVLRLVSKMGKSEITVEIIEKVIFSALKKMLSEFDPEKVKDRNKIYKKHHKTLIETSVKYALIYLQTLKALHCVILKDFGFVEKAETEQTSDFLLSINTEMEIEKE